MSKYNLIDLYEEYKIGSGWTNDFDYNGMLNAGLALNAETDVETLKKVVEDFTDVNYHREAAHLYDAIEALEEGAIKEASMFFGDFHAEIKATMEDLGMDTSDDLGAYMASKMEENTEAVDLAIETSQKKAGLKEGKGVPPMKDIVLALIKDAKGTNPEIESYVKSLKQSGDEFDDVDDYVEDFKNYVADKSLQEHFGRFLKDFE